MPGYSKPEPDIVLLSMSRELTDGMFTTSCLIANDDSVGMHLQSRDSPHLANTLLDTTCILDSLLVSGTLSCQIRSITIEDIISSI